MVLDMKEQDKIQMVVHPFAPLIDEQSKVLILGSFPSVISREKNFYYANRNNRFWPVMEEVFQETITDRKAFCHKHHIALWDVIHSCFIHGSSDASITNVVPNNIAKLVENTNIGVIFTTGKKAGALYRKYIQCDLKHMELPSTSSANASMRKRDLIKAYQIIKEYCDEKG